MLLRREEKEVGHKPDKDGFIRYSQWIPGASDVGPDDETRSYWERMLREEAKQNARQAAARKTPPEFGPQASELKQNLRGYLAQPSTAVPQSTTWPQSPPDPNARSRVTTMVPAKALTRGNRTISPETVMGTRRPEFGPSPAELGARLRAWLGIRMENRQPTYRPTAEQKQIIKDHLATRSMPTKQVDDLKFVSGPNDEAGFFTRKVQEWFDPIAVTQGNTVYVRPNKFVDVVGFNSDTPFEEAYHSADFASEGGAGFYPPYLLNAVGGWISTGDGYYGNPQESFAKGAARKMYEAYRHQRLQKGK